MAEKERLSIWDFTEAKLKCEEKHSCFVEIERQEHISLSPFYIGRINLGVQEQIEKKIRQWKYLEEYGGVIVAYENIKLLERLATIDDESPLIHFDIKISYIIFKPELGKKLVGIVNKISNSHVGCLVHGRFNASLKKSDLYQNDRIENKTFNIGTQFVFRICDINTVGGLLSIAGCVKEKDKKYIRLTCN
ncbi:DNA-directed RNA polymerase I subunit RPA43-like isoform X2 [Xenia sp. Carnegie-2017]|uniref:DNA-directed RNA polymerase I subunit RPA43-like isoform X2 n=1 Tax=Xenia sp. Carnegie-2017 TaxID=2897299 RepID=UPI001F03F3AC|nr:DNA-directed RNA polymerase I subunit RPA43-like isoform X2 [Xenia sp. Carnegie-2017]XP_046860098.1 DNA-directed RNA polymerase I subunit RPA43-like isoform X2 [Xenia sp. Carnegie-2017]